MALPQALDSLALAPKSAFPCDVRDLNVVYMRRERAIWNEDQVLDSMRELTPHITARVIEEYTPYQIQVNIFAQADIVVSVHGSQLVNQMFMRKGAGLLEIFPHSYYHDEQKRLSANTLVDHIELMDNPMPPREAVSAPFLPLWDKSKTLTQQFPGTQSCMAQYSC